jgi:hypothetical protein
MGEHPNTWMVSDSEWGLILHLALLLNDDNGAQLISRLKA